MRQLKNNGQIITLQSGLRIACRQVPNAKVEYCGAVVKAGSRDDPADAPGLAHFVEHTIFKGTQRRSSWHIINRMERVGGELNAYTSKEETVVYTAAPVGNLVRAMDLIADLLTSSRFPDSELDKEREVVADEINSYLDTPADAVYDDFEDLLFAGSPLGHNILGNIDALATFDSQKCQAYLHRWYTPRNMAIFYCGPVKPERVAAVVEKYFASLSSEDSAALRGIAPIAKIAPFEEMRKLDIHQAHTVMGAQIEGMHGSNRYALALLTNILGGPGMNSLLNVALREKRGLVYSVEANTSLYTDCGEFTIYFGCDPEDTDKCKELVRNEIDKMCDGISLRALQRAQKQYLGQLAVGSDNKESSSIGLGRAALFYGELLSPSEIEARIRSVTPQALAEAASSLLPLSVLTLG